MKNLENYGVQELNTQEVNQVEGGYWQIVIAACALATVSMAAGYYAGKAYYYVTH